MTTDYFLQLSELSRADEVTVTPVQGAIVFRIVQDGKVVTEQRCEDSLTASNAIILVERFERLKQAERRLIVKED